MKYFSIVFMISVYVVFYVWQNIEMMKMKMDYKKLIKTEKEITIINDKLKFDFERLRSFRAIEANAEKNNLRQISPSDLIVLNVNESVKNVKEEKK